MKLFLFGIAIVLMVAGLLDLAFGTFAAFFVVIPTDRAIRLWTHTCAEFLAVIAILQIIKAK